MKRSIFLLVATVAYAGNPAPKAHVTSPEHGPRALPPDPASFELGVGSLARVPEAELKSHEAQLASPATSRQSIAAPSALRRSASDPSLMRNRPQLTAVYYIGVLGMGTAAAWIVGIPGSESKAQ